MADELIQAALQLVAELPERAVDMTAAQMEARAGMQRDFADAFSATADALGDDDADVATIEEAGLRALDAQRASAVLDEWDERSGLNELMGEAKRDTPVTLTEDMSGRLLFGVPVDEAGRGAEE
ncbi:MAG TPA: hypothetical protein VMA83_09790 [Solirubrobacteraceae bacterium]|nr:hypothetical protein [Solirubrobacteraceae bacterium]